MSPGKCLQQARGCERENKLKCRFFVFILGVLSLNLSAQEVKLDEVVQIALKKNYDVLVLQKTSDIAANDNRYAFGAFLPLINATGALVRPTNNSRNLTFSDVPTNVDNARSTQGTSSVQLVWTLFDGTRMFATRKRIEELAILGEANVRNQMMNTAALVMSTYYNIIRQKQQLKAIEELIMKHICLVGHNCAEVQRKKVRGCSAPTNSNATPATSFCARSAAPARPRSSVRVCW